MARNVKDFEADYALRLDSRSQVTISVREFIRIDKQNLKTLLKKNAVCFYVDTSKPVAELYDIDASDNLKEELSRIIKSLEIECYQLAASKGVTNFQVSEAFSGKVFLEERKNLFRVEYFGWAHWHYNWWFLRGKLIHKDESFFD